MPLCRLGVCHAILGTAVMEATWADCGFCWGWMLCQMGANQVSEGGLGHIAAAALLVAVQLNAALGSYSVLC